MGEENIDYSNMTLKEYYIFKGLENASDVEKISALRALGVRIFHNAEVRNVAENLKMYELGARQYYFSGEKFKEVDNNSFRD